MVKLALGSGHSKFTPGKRILKSLDTNETREWVLNDKIVTGVIERLDEYQDVKILRVDDATGNIDIPLKERVDMVNKFNPDLYLSFHHNAGIKGGSGGGIEVYTSVGASKTSKTYQDLIYKELISYTGLKGNRSNPTPSFNFYVLKYSTCPAVLIEHGYMDSVVDVPIILSNEFVNKCIDAHISALVKHFNLKKKNTAKTIYRVQVGAYGVKSNAEQMLSNLKDAGFNGFIKEDIVQVANTPKEITLPKQKDKMSDYYKIGDSHIIETIPSNIKIAILGNTLHEADVYGINGTFYDTPNPTDPNSCWAIATNEGKPIGGNSMVNSYDKSIKRGTITHYLDGSIGNKKVNTINEFHKPHDWSIGGYTVKPYMDFKGEKLASGINYRTGHSYIGFDKDNHIYLIVKPYHLIQEIVPLADELGLIGMIVIDGGGSSQLRHPDGFYASSRKINSAILLKEV